MTAVFKTTLKKITDKIDHGMERFLTVYRNLSIRTKLMVVLNIVIVIPLVTISLVSYKNSEDVLENKSSQYSQDILKIINLRFDDDLTRLDSISNDILTDATIDDFIVESETENGQSYDYQKSNAVRDRLKNLMRTKDEIQSVSIFYGDNHCYADKNSQAISIESILSKNSVTLDKINDIAEASDGTPSMFVYTDPLENKYLFYIRPILDRNTYKNEGLMVVMVNNRWLSTVFNGLVNNDMQNTAFLDVNKQPVIRHGSSDDFNLTYTMFEKMTETSGLLVNDNQKILYSYVTNEKTGWKVVTSIPLSQLYRDVEYIKQRIFLALLFAILFLLLISFYISIDFVSSINIIVGGMQKLQNGEENVQVELKRKDELGFMGETFNTMVREITTLQNWVIKEKLTRKEAQIKALQSQINPHFLFNTLETINWIAQLNNVPQISSTVTALASLMEASIAREGKCITLREEIGYIDNYILILKQRFEDRLELIKNIDESVLSVMIPRLLIQPLVENAANHGVANIRGKGVVKLDVTHEGENVTISVEDNGTGISADELDMINERLSMDDDEYFKETEKKKKRGIGLENVNRRIKLFYGQQYGVKIDSEYGIYTRVTVTIPLEESEKIPDNNGNDKSGSESLDGLIQK